MLQTLISKFSLFAAALMMLSLSGCGGPPPEPSGTISGTVKSGGELCGDCRISIFNPSTLLSKGGTVDESGAFELKDLPFGNYDISIGQKPSNAVVEVFDKRIPKKFRSKKTSGLKASLTAEEPVATLDVEM